MVCSAHHCACSICDAITICPHGSVGLVCLLALPPSPGCPLEPPRERSLGGGVGSRVSKEEYGCLGPTFGSPAVWMSCAFLLVLASVPFFLPGSLSPQYRQDIFCLCQLSKLLWVLAPPDPPEQVVSKRRPLRRQPPPSLAVPYCLYRGPPGTLDSPLHPSAHPPEVAGSSESLQGLWGLRW